MLLVLFVLASLFVGGAAISLGEVMDSLLFSSEFSTHEQIVWHYRFPRSMNAVLCGLSLPISGFLLQALFRNPLAGPSVFGLTSSSGLGVAIMIFLAYPLGLLELVNSSLAIVLAAFAGAFLSTLVISFLAVRVRTNSALIIAGFMIAGFASAIIALLQFYSSDNELRRFLVWNFGSLTAVSFSQLFVYSTTTIIGLFGAFYFLKNLFASLIGDAYAQSMGVKIKTTRLGVLLTASLLTAAATAFAGPIAFLGLAIPHVSTFLFPSANFRERFLLTLLIGPIFMLFTLILSEVIPGGRVPINIILSLMGAPFLVLIILKNKDL